jgi:ATP-binding cassette subfamily F protein 3
VVFELLDGRVEVGEHIVLLDDVELWLERGEHVSLVGRNGTGKTTLINALSGRRELAAGTLRVGHNVKIGYLSQHADELGVGGANAQSVLDATQQATGLTPNKARALLGRFLFSGEDAEKPLAGLSGGERRRLSLAILVHSGANVLILDEPTNHLDIESREALEDALSAFAGAVLLVTHDRALLDAVGRRTIAIEERDDTGSARLSEAGGRAGARPATLRTYPGGWAEYARVREERREGSAKAGGQDVDGRAARARARSPVRPADRAHGAAAPRGARSNGAGAATAAKLASKDRRKREGPSKNRQSAIARAERAVEDAEAAMRALEDELSDPAKWATAYESAKSQARHTAARRAVEAAFAELEALSE